MKFALLGDDPAALTLLEAIAAAPDHALTHAAGVVDGEMLAAALRLAPGLRVGSSWEDLLEGERAEAVIVAGASENVLRGAVQLAGAVQALAVFPQAKQGSAWVYELALLQNDGEVQLVPMLPRLLHPAIADVRRRLTAGELGRVLYLELERRVTVSAQQPSPLLAPADLDAALLPDVALLRNLAGNYHRVTAIHSAATAQGVAAATVTLAGDGLPEAVWTAKPTTEPPGWRLTITGERERIVLAGGDDAGEVSLDETTVAAVDSGADQLARIESAIRGTESRPGWDELTRSIETVEATRGSIRRRRTVELYFDAPSERSQFKTQMTAVGCGVLLLTLMGVVGVLLAGSLFDPEEMSAAGRIALQIARVVVFLPLAVFLVLQLLVFVARPSPSDGHRASNESTSASEAASDS